MYQTPLFDFTVLPTPVGPVPISSKTRVINQLKSFDLNLPSFDLLKRTEIKNQLTITLVTDVSNDKIVKGYRYTIESKTPSVMLLNKAIAIDTPNVGVPIEFGAYERLPAAPIIRNDISPGEYFSSYNKIDKIETYIKLRDGYVCRHGLYIALEGPDVLIITQYDMGLPIKFESFFRQTVQRDSKFIIQYDKLGYPSSIDTSQYYIRYKGLFADGKILYKKYPGIDVTTTKDIVTGTYSIDMYLGTLINVNKMRYINSSPYKLNTQTILYNHLSISMQQLKSIKMSGTLKPIKYQRDIHLLLGIESIDNKEITDLSNYLNMMVISEGPVKCYWTDGLGGQILQLFDEFNIINGTKTGVEHIYINDSCSTFNTIITHECHSNKTGGNIITIFWIDGKYVTKDQYMIQKAKLEHNIEQSVVPTSKIPLGNIISNYLGFLDG